MQLVEDSHMASKLNLLKLWLHETMRTYFDRLVLPQDKAWLLKTLRTIALKRFDLVLGDFWLTI